MCSRDDCGNVWHALAEFVRVFEMLLVLDIPLEAVQILIVDKHFVCHDVQKPDCVSQCPYHESWSALGLNGVYSAASSLTRGSRLLARNLLIVSDDYHVIWGHARLCQSREILQLYRDNLFLHLGIPRRLRTLSRVVRVTLSRRKTKPFGKHPPGRRIRNANQLTRRILSSQSDLLMETGFQIELVSIGIFTSL